MAQRRREAEYERTGDRKKFLYESHEKLGFLMVPDKNFDNERDRDEDEFDEEMWKRSGSIRCKGCQRRSCDTACLPCGHKVCLHCVESTEEVDEHDVWFKCVLCNKRCNEFCLLE